MCTRAESQPCGAVRNAAAVRCAIGEEAEPSVRDPARTTFPSRPDCVQHKSEAIRNSEFYAFQNPKHPQCRPGGPLCNATRHPDVPDPQGNSAAVTARERREEREEALVRQDVPHRLHGPVEDDPRACAQGSAARRGSSCELGSDTEALMDQKIGQT